MTAYQSRVPKDIAVVEVGELRSCGRIATTPEQLELFAASLGPDDRVALEVTGNAWEIARIIEPHVARVLVVSPSDTGIRRGKGGRERDTGARITKPSKGKAAGQTTSP